MKKRTILGLLLSHGFVGAVGFAAGIYFLPILIAPPAPTESEVAEASQDASFTGEFKRDLAGSDGLHWGEGKLSIGKSAVSLMGELAPGPDYKLYLSPDFVETEAAFSAIKDKMVVVGDVKTFKNFVLSVPADVDPTQYTTAIVWCETFGEFITAAKYR